MKIIKIMDPKIKEIGKICKNSEIKRSAKQIDSKNTPPLHW